MLERFKMRKIRLSASASYDVLVGENLIQPAGQYVREISSARKVLIITDEVVKGLYFDIIAESLGESDFEVLSYVVASGEASKSLLSAEKIYSFLLENQFTRSDLIVALGGGVVGDLAGFVASTYMRGVDFVQIPTTLLAQIDASVGGKNGINLPQGKNLVGTIHQPRLVLADTNTLATLPKKLISDGMAEAIKCSLIKSSEFFNKIKNLELKDFLEDLIFECINIKKEIVEADEFEQNERKLLNFGHTLGHAIEKFYNFSGYTHGQAVAVGMACAARAGKKLGITKASAYEELISVLEKYQLPTEVPCDIEALIEIAKSDKKSAGDFFDVVLIESIGNGFVKRIPTADLRKYIGG